MKKKFSLSNGAFFVLAWVIFLMGNLPFAYPQDATRSRTVVTQDGADGSSSQNSSAEGRTSGVEAPLEGAGLPAGRSEEDQTGAPPLGEFKKPMGTILDPENFKNKFVMKRYSQLALGPNYTLVLTARGTVWGWGYNINGNLGLGKFSNSEPSPVKLPVLKDIVEIGAGLMHACALTKGQDVYCWGHNELGQLGTASPLNAANSLPSKVPIDGIKNISVGSFLSCALSANYDYASSQSGEVFCWGDNGAGELGIQVNKSPSANTYNYPVKSNMYGIVSMTAGQSHTCELIDPNATQSTQAYNPTEALALPICFGENTYGQLGTGSTQTGNLQDSTWVKTFSEGKLHQMSAGAAHTCALTTKDNSGLVYCWGLNDYGQLGNLTTENSSVPTQVKLTVTQPLVGIKEVRARTAHTCAVTDKGTAYCWGGNSAGQLGDGTKIDHHSPVQVMLSPSVPLTGVKTLGIGDFHTCAIVSIDPNKDDKIYCWGSNWKGQLGLGAGAQSSSYPVEVKMPIELAE